MAKIGDELEEDAYHEYLSAQIFYAFSFEGLLNLLGMPILNCWDQKSEKQREFSTWRKKLRRICQELDYENDESSKPLSVITELMDELRNKVAHPKPTFLSDEKWFKLENREEARRHRPLFYWETLLTKEHVELVRCNLIEIATNLTSLAKEKGYNVDLIGECGHYYSLADMPKPE